MIETRKDFDLLVKATECCRDFVSIKVLEEWIKSPFNIMFIEGDNVGVATRDYPGMYTVHWYYNSARGKEAIKLGKAMCVKLFEEHGGQVLRGLIKTRLKASRWACRQLGFKSKGFLTYEDGDENEVLFASKDDFMKGVRHG